MDTEAENIAVVNNEADQRFQAEVGGNLAYLQYHKRQGQIVYTHTEVPKEMEGKGIGGKLAKAALEQAKAEHLRVVAQCPFVASYIQRHKEYQPLLASD